MFFSCFFCTARLESPWVYHGFRRFFDARHLFTTLYLDVSIPALEAHTRPGDVWMKSWNSWTTTTTTASYSQFQPVFVDVHGLKMFPFQKGGSVLRFGLKVAPSEHQQIFDSVDKLVKGLFKELDVVSLGGVSTVGRVKKRLVVSRNGKVPNRHGNSSLLRRTSSAKSAKKNP